MAFVAVLLFLVGIIAVYLIIRTAINSSEAAKSLAEIRDVLKKWDMEKRAVDMNEGDNTGRKGPGNY